MKKILAGTYQIKNLTNNKVYNGSSHNLKRRLQAHQRSLQNQKASPHLQKAWNKYGAESFSLETTKEVATLFGPFTREDKAYLKEFFLPNLLYWEQVRLDEDESYKPEKGYNICPVAGSTLGTTRTEETRERMKRSLKGLPKSEEAKKNIGDSQRGKPKSQEHCKNISDGMQGHEVTPETRGNISKALKESEKFHEVMQSDEFREKQRLAQQGKILSEEHKEHIGEGLRKFHEVNNQ